MANWNNPTLTSTYTNFVTEVKDRDVEAAVWFENMTPTNLPTNAKRLNTSTGRFEKWNGTAWVDAVATFTFPALSVAGATTLAGALTISAGTANGVAYLNGSKVLTTGAALTFNGTNFGIGIASPARKLHVAEMDAGYGMRVSGPSGDNNWAGGIEFYSNNGTSITSSIIVSLNGMLFNYGGSERMRLNASGQLGIGTSTPLATVDARVAASGTPLRAAYFSNGTDTDLQVMLSTGLTLLANSVAAPLAFGTGGTERMRLDGSGNLGIGTTLPISRVNIVGGVLNSGGGTGLGIATGLAAGRFASGPGVVALASSTDASTVEISAGSSGGQSGIAVSGSGGDVPSTVRIYANGAERARIDSSGNLISNSSVTGHWQIPNGTTAQRPTGAAGQIRFNTSLTRYEGHNGTAWSSIGGGATGGGSDDVFYENGQTVTTNYTITTNKNAMSAGPVTIASGITVTVPPGSTWTVV